jgi:hypothetical protein
VPRERGGRTKDLPGRRPSGPSPGALARVASPRPPASPGAAALLIERPPPALHFRSIVRFVAPDARDRIWRARHPECGRESARVAAFLDLLRADWFATVERQHPAYYGYGDVTAGIPLARYGWDDDDLCSIHDFHPGFLLLFALSEATYQDDDYRTGVIGELDGLLPDALLERIPVYGIPRARLRARLGARPFAALADFADWIARETGLEHLDTCHEEGVETAWTRPNLLRLREEWPRADALLDRVGALVEWLEADSANQSSHFAALATAALDDAPTPIADSRATGVPTDEPVRTHI